MIVRAQLSPECQMAPRALINATNALMCCLLRRVAPLAVAAGPSGAQQKGAEAFLAAVATGNPRRSRRSCIPTNSRNCARA